MWWLIVQFECKLDSLSVDMCNCWTITGHFMSCIFSKVLVDLINNLYEFLYKYLKKRASRGPNSWGLRELGFRKEQAIHAVVFISPLDSKLKFKLLWGRTKKKELSFINVFNSLCTILVSMSERSRLFCCCTFRRTDDTCVSITQCI